MIYCPDCGTGFAGIHQNWDLMFHRSVCDLGITWTMAHLMAEIDADRDKGDH